MVKRAIRTSSTVVAILVAFTNFGFAWKKCYLETPSQLAELQMMCGCGQREGHLLPHEYSGTATNLFVAATPIFHVEINRDTLREGQKEINMMHNVKRITMSDCDNVLINLIQRGAYFPSRGAVGNQFDDNRNDDQLARDSNDPERTHTVDLDVKNVKNLTVVLSRSYFNESRGVYFHVGRILLENVTYSGTIFNGPATIFQLDEAATAATLNWMGITDKNLYFYIMLVLVAVTGICIFFLVAVTCYGCHRKEAKTLIREGDQEHCCCCTCCYLKSARKKLTRANSWRYEASIYVKPPQQRGNETAMIFNTQRGNQQHMCIQEGQHLVSPGDSALITAGQYGRNLDRQVEDERWFGVRQLVSQSAKLPVQIGLISSPTYSTAFDNNLTMRVDVASVHPQD